MLVGGHVAIVGGHVEDDDLVPVGEIGRDDLQSLRCRPPRPAVGVPLGELATCPRHPGVGVADDQHRPAGKIAVDELGLRAGSLCRAAPVLLPPPDHAPLTLATGPRYLCPR